MRPWENIWSTAPLTPTLKAEPDGPRAILVSWEEPFAFEGVRSVTGYELQGAKDRYSEIWRNIPLRSSTALSHRHAGLNPGETWYYRVRATNGGRSNGA